MPRFGRPLVAVVALASVAVVAIAVAASGALSPASSSPSAPVTGLGSPSNGATPGPTATPTPAPTVNPTPEPTPVVTPEPTPTLVAAPLTGRMVTEDVAERHPIAVMIDDLSPARPQSGFNAASVVWQAPAEGGIPRYMMIFQDQLPASVGPVRSSRYYYIAWASELRAVYVHVGGSPQALQTLREQGHGELVFNADEFRYGGKYLWRIKERFAPHNVYSDGDHLRQLAAIVKAADGPISPAWTFAPDALLEDRPIGGSIDVVYPKNAIHYDYDYRTNTYLRGVTGEKAQVDAATGDRVAPKNVVVMLVHFGPLNDGHPTKHRLEAQVVGSGPAWIATNGVTVKGTWKKDAVTAPTRFFDAKGRPVTFTVGQTFVQVLAYGSKITVADGKRVSYVATVTPHRLDPS